MDRGPLLLEKNMQTIGLIGLGVMGRAMAANLLKAGFPLIVFNRTLSRCDELADLGAVVAASPAELASKSHTVLVIVSDTAAVESILFGPKGLADGLHKGAVVIDMSTISPASTIQFAERLRRLGCEMLDAPVSGGEEGAQKATLTIMAGGTPKVFEDCLPLFRALGKNITYTGTNGNGQKTKLVNQVIGALNLLATIEGIRLASASGLDLQCTLQAVSGGAAASWMLGNVPPKIQNHDFEPGFSIRLEDKDLNLAQELAKESGDNFPGLALVHSLFAEATRAGLGHEATHGLIHLWSRSATAN
jgi:3-hydroxyisobutyrate dehydrogenase-like beta-hydroxyacid dehydrogenase